MKKIFVLRHGITKSKLGSVALVYLIAFLVKLFIPWPIDSGDMGLAAATNIGLITLFGLQHSIRIILQKVITHQPGMSHRTLTSKVSALAPP